MSERRDLILHGLVFGLALAVRLVLLGARPLDDAEAGLALQALALARGDAAGGAQPGYVLGTGLLFLLNAIGPAAARLVPALAGSLLALAPYFLRSWLGRTAALIAAVGLALDPGLLAFSRQADGLILAGAFGSLALAAWLNGRRAWAGVLTGLALLGGPQVWPGLAAFAVAAAALRGRFPGRLAGAGENPETAIQPTWRPYWTALGATILAAGTLFLRAPGGVGMLADSLPTYLSSWSQADPFRFIPANIWLLMLPIYAPIPLLFGGWGLVRGFRRSGEPGGALVDRFLGIFFLAALLLGLLNPGREPAGWLWVLLPLWGLAARSLSGALRYKQEDGFPALAQAGLTLLLLAFSWLTLVIAMREVASGELLMQTTTPWVLGGILLMLAITSGLMAWGWGRDAAGHGFAIGLTAALAVYTLSAAAGAGGLRSPATAELWRPWGTPDQISLAVDTIQDLSRLNTLSATGASVEVAAIDSPALRWALRDFEQANFSASLPSATMPDLVLTTASSQQPALAAAYRGQDFTLTRIPEWTQLDGTGWLAWLVSRKVPSQFEQMIVWGRTDLFPDNAPAESADSIP